MTEKNLGQIAAVYFGEQAPSNQKILWYKESDGKFRFYDVVSGTWTPLAGETADGSVTNSKLAEMPGKTIKGNSAFTSGTPSDLTTGQVKVMLDLEGSNTGDQDLSGLQTKDLTGLGASVPEETDLFSFWSILGIVRKKISWANVKATLKTYFDGLYPAISMPANSVKGNQTATTANATDIALAVMQVLGRLSGNLQAIDLIESALNIGAFTGNYAGLATESNWTNNFTNSVPGNSGDLHFGVGENGTSYYAFYGQSGWNRFYSDSRINGSTTTFGTILINEIITSTNWNGFNTFNATSGDLGQQFVNEGYLYKCVDGDFNTWFREPIISNTLTITDATYIPKPDVKILDGSTTAYTYVIPAKYDIISILAKADDVETANIRIGTTIGGNELLSDTALPTIMDNYIKLNFDRTVINPSSSDATIHITTSAATKEATLQIVLQKLFS